MSNATKCDRCGGYFEQGGRSIRQGFGVNMVEFDLCEDCAAAFDVWMKCQPVTCAPERVTNDGEMLHDTREQIESELQETNKSNSQFDVLKTAETAENATPKNGIHNFDDSREQLELDVTAYLIDKVCTWEKQRYELRCEVERWLDRQAEITRRDVLCQPDERDEQIAELEAEIATLKEHRAGNMERLHELTDECAELRKYRDEWKGLAEKYRADSIAAQEECERYRAKLGDVLDAIHEAERAAR